MPSLTGAGARSVEGTEKGLEDAERMRLFQDLPHLSLRLQVANGCLGSIASFMARLMVKMREIVDVEKVTKE